MASIVEYFSSRFGSCGYCKTNSNTSRSSSMWAHALTVDDYQELIDRGWRRSGSYCYKPNMRKTCCPLYTIRCNALDFKPSKSQKKLMKRVSKFVIEGKKNVVTNDEHDYHGEQGMEMLDIASDNIKMNIKDIEKADFSNCKNIPEIKKIPKLTDDPVKQGDGKDDAKPVCKKAKMIRLERKKLKNGGEVCKKMDTNQEKTLEDLIKFENPALKLELRLVSSEPPCQQFIDTFDESFNVYQKYQTTIHRDSPNQCSTKQFKRFLVNSPLKKKEANGLPCGSFHHQYILDGKIIAVGVVDILPNCISSVYFYYDPDYSFLSLGTYSSLREIALVRSLNKKYPQLKYYYMGFYIHTCPKMSYKSRLSHSFLLCPETYTWHPVEECKKKLEINKYSRFGKDDDEDKNIVLDINQVFVLWKNTGMTYEMYKVQSGSSDDTEVNEYAQLIGAKCLKIFLYRP